MTRAAISLVTSGDKILCVWNRCYGGWTLPGGKVEPRETDEQAQARELYEETNLQTFMSEKIYEGENGADWWVVAYRVWSTEVSHVAASQMEDGCPIAWFSREDLLRWSPFRSFYERMFAALDKT